MGSLFCKYCSLTKIHNDGINVAWGSLCMRKICCPFKKRKNKPKQTKNMHPVLTLLILISSLNNVLPAIKHSDRADHKDSCAWDTKGAHVDYPIGLGLFSCCEKSALKLRHWIKVSRTEFEACGWMQPYWGCTTAVLVIPPHQGLCCHCTSGFTAPSK